MNSMMNWRCAGRPHRCFALAPSMEGPAAMVDAIQEAVMSRPAQVSSSSVWVVNTPSAWAWRAGLAQVFLRGRVAADRADGSAQRFAPATTILPTATPAPSGTSIS
ncbi:MAG: hypothetical protein IPF85_16545 [Anaerolineae bacterium]|nr:hypothetical protein [Anaerolineae bacterium]